MVGRGSTQETTMYGRLKAGCVRRGVAAGLALTLALAAGTGLAMPMLGNTVGGAFSFIGGCTACGGDLNVTNGNYQVIGGGKHNQTGTYDNATIAGGQDNRA